MKNVFENAGDVLSGGIDTLFSQIEEPEFMIDLDEIEIVEQVREQMEDDEQSLAGLGDSLAKLQIHAIFLRIMPAGHPKPYRLIAGERRYRAAKLKGLSQLRAKAREMTDEEAADLQFAENIHRLNLSQLEEAKKIQRDLNTLGSVEAVLEKHHKSRAWLSKTLGLLTLPEQTKRLLTENVTADNEVIGAVKAVESVDPAKAKELVDELKKTRGDGNAREKAKAVKDEVKPSPKKAAAKAKAEQKPDAKTEAKAETNTGANATPGREQRDIELDGDAAQILQGFYFSIYEFGAKPNVVLDSMDAATKTTVKDYLYNFYSAGKQAKDAGRAAMLGLRSGEFATDGVNAFNLVSFIYGLSGVDFDLLNIFGSVKE
jgi:ParB family transcriptional regulator, chromosome partitioning protein